jgi:Helix-turn-helix domain
MKGNTEASPRENKSAPPPAAPNQRERILNLLLAAYRSRREVSLREILDLKISQYSARICELRQEGWRIQNRTARNSNGQRISFFWLEYDRPAVQLSLVDVHPAGSPRERR